MNAFLRELKALQQEELNFQEISFQVKYVNGMTMSE